MVCDTCLFCSCNVAPLPREERLELEVEVEQWLSLPLCKDQENVFLFAKTEPPPLAALPPADTASEEAEANDSEYKPRTGKRTGKRRPAAAADPPMFKQRTVYVKRSEYTSFLLKEWFEAHVTWPYPDRAETRHLMDHTKLNQNQISHFFVNWRKRHWAAVFNRVIPLNQAAVELFLERKFGSLEAGVARLRAL
jgi:hypothetical protein